MSVDDGADFNLDSDPGESKNLASANPELLAELIDAWEAYALEVGVVPAKL